MAYYSNNYFLFIFLAKFLLRAETITEDIVD
jgi:hypothetical protein